MARADIKVIKGGTSHYRRKVRVDDRDTSSLAQLVYGDVVKRGGAGANFATIVLNGDPEVGTDLVLGVTAKDSTETATADGIVEYFTAVPTLSVLRGNAATAGNVDTDAELLVIERDWVAFDRSAATVAGVLTIDEDEGDDPNVHGLQILTGDIVNGTLDVSLHALATEAGTTI